MSTSLTSRKVDRMTDVTLIPVDVDGDDRQTLIELLASIVVPFHVTSHPDSARIAAQIEEGDWGGTKDDEGDHATFFVVDAGEAVGVLRLDDITDDAPMFDLRLVEGARGRGIGFAAITALADHVFAQYPDVDRIEGQTREDNIAMRRVFQRAGWTKEAHYRRGWPVADAEPVASVAYAVLRSEWETGTREPLVWDDLPPRER